MPAILACQSDTSQAIIAPLGPYGLPGALAKVPLPRNTKFLFAAFQDDDYKRVRQ
jgi:hypothetical protein